MPLVIRKPRKFMPFSSTTTPNNQSSAVPTPPSSTISLSVPSVTRNNSQQFIKLKTRARARTKTLSSFSLASSSSTITSRINLISLSFLAEQSPTFITRTSLMTWRKHSRIVEIRSNCLLIYRKPPQADLSNADDLLILTHNHHPHAINSNVVFVDENHSFHFNYPRQATAFRAALLTITETPPPNHYCLLDTLHKSSHSTIYTAKQIQNPQQQKDQQNFLQNSNSYKNKNKPDKSHNNMEDINSSNNSHSNSEHSEPYYNQSAMNTANGGNAIKQKNKISNVFMNIRNKNDEIYTVKSIPKIAIIGTDTNKVVAYKRFLHERLLLQKAAEINSPFIVRLVDAFETKCHYHFVTELAHYGSLDRIVNNHNHNHSNNIRRLSENVIRHIFSELVLAIYDVHSFGYIYRNLNLQNILVNSKGHIKLNDFSLVKQVQIEYDLLNNNPNNHNHNKNNKRFYLIGRTSSFIHNAENKNFISPEQILNEKNSIYNYGSSCDIWSLGVILYNLLVGHHPFHNLNNDKNKLNWYILNKRIIVPSTMQHISQNAMDLIHAMLHRDELNRIDIYGIMQHPWFNNINWNQLRYNAQQNLNVDPFTNSIQQLRIPMIQMDAENKKTFNYDNGYKVNDVDSFKEMIYKQQQEQLNGSNDGEDNEYNDWLADNFNNGNKLLGFDFVR